MTPCLTSTSTTAAVVDAAGRSSFATCAVAAVIAQDAPGSALLWPQHGSTGDVLRGN